MGVNTATSFITKAAVFVVEIEEFLPLNHDYGWKDGLSGGLGNPMQDSILSVESFAGRGPDEIQYSPQFC